MAFYIFTVMALAATSVAQYINIPPKDVTQRVGEEAKFECVTNLSIHKLMSWEFNGHVLYFYEDRTEEPPKNQDKYEVVRDGEKFILVVKDLQLRDGGTYTCSVTKQEFNANLIVLSKPEIREFSDNKKEPPEVIYTCAGVFGGPPEADISAEHLPKLRIFLDGKLIINEKNVSKLEHKSGTNEYTLRQFYNTEPTEDGREKKLMCELKTDKPEGYNIVNNVIHPHERKNEQVFSKTDSEDSTWKIAVTVTVCLTILIGLVCAGFFYAVKQKYICRSFFGQEGGIDSGEGERMLNSSEAENQATSPQQQESDKIASGSQDNSDGDNNLPVGTAIKRIEDQINAETFIKIKGQSESKKQKRRDTPQTKPNRNDKNEVKEPSSNGKTETDESRADRTDSKKKPEAPGGVIDDKSEQNLDSKDDIKEVSSQGNSGNKNADTAQFDEDIKVESFQGIFGKKNSEPAYDDDIKKESSQGNSGIKEAEPSNDDDIKKESSQGNSGKKEAEPSNDDIKIESSQGNSCKKEAEPTNVQEDTSNSSGEELLHDKDRHEAPPPAGSKVYHYQNFQDYIDEENQEEDLTEQRGSNIGEEIPGKEMKVATNKTEAELSDVSHQKEDTAHESLEDASSNDDKEDWAPKRNVKEITKQFEENIGDPLKDRPADTSTSEKMSVSDIVKAIEKIKS